MIVPKIKTGEKQYGPLVYDSWPTASTKLRPDGETYLVKFSEPRLRIDKKEIPADASIFALIEYPAIETVHFLIDNHIYSVEPKSGWAQIEIASDSPGMIVISVEDESVSLFVTDS